MRTVNVAILLALGLSVPAQLQPAHAGDARVPSLSTPADTLRWSGSFSSAHSPGPETCGLTPCHSFAFHVDLPSAVWNGADGVQVAIEWKDTDFDLDLYVYGPSNHLVGRSTSLHFAQGQAVRIEAAQNGNYRAVVVPNSISPYAAIRDVSFRGIVGVGFPPSSSPARELLPDLVALPPANLKLQTGTAVPGSPYVSTQHSVPGSTASCYPEEELQPDRRCLRFDQGVGNVGEGPLEIRQPTPDLADGTLIQRIYASDGAHRDVALSADAQFHASHGHFHYAAFAQSRLYEATLTGRRGALVRTGKKNGFCLTDVRNLWFDRSGGEPRTYVFPGACDPQADPDTFLVAGVSPGWADVYSWYLVDQYIDVTGLQGEFILELEMNLDRGIVEKHPTNNAASVRIRLHSNSVEVL